MAQGTGLPGGRGDVATTITDMRGFGAGEAAAAEAMARAADGLGRLVRTLEPAAQQEATRLAEQDVDAGRFRERIVLTGADAAFNDALRSGTLARLGNQADDDLNKLRVQFAYDPDGFASATEALRSTALEKAVPGEMAMPWAADFDRRRTSMLGTIRNARAEADLREAHGSLKARTTRLVDDTISAANGRPLAEVMADPLVLANLEQLAAGHEELAANPAFGVSPEEAAAARDADLARIKAGVVSAGMLNTLRTEGPDAALAALQTIQTDEALQMTREERQLAFNTARDAVQQEIGLANQRRNQAAAERSAADEDLRRQMEEDVARLELTGEGSGLTQQQVFAVGGNAAVSRWLKARADAVEFHSLIGDLPDDPDEAAALIAQRTAQRGMSALPQVADDADFDTIAGAIEQVESGGVNGLVSGDPDGAGPAGGGAFGVMQVLPDTARRIAGQLGLPFDAARLRNDRAYNRQIGRAYLRELMDRYRGDAFLAITAYHAGEGNVDGWIRSVGDPRTGAITREAWLNGVEARGNPRSAAYPRKVLAALGAGQANAAWDAYRGQREARRADPATSVATDFAVKAARDRWQAAPNSVPAGEAFVQANLDAQARSNIREGQRRTLPVRTLAIYAGDLERYARAGDTEAFHAYSERVVRQFGKHGRAVLQDVLEVRGDTQFAAMVTARVTQQAAQGQRPSPQEVEQASRAGRTESMNRAASGQTNRSVSAMTDDEVLAAAGL